jgi:hypothetical protein
MDTAAKSTFWEIPFVWGTKDLKDISVDPSKISKASTKKSDSG